MSTHNLLPETDSALMTQGSNGWEDLAAQFPDNPETEDFSKGVSPLYDNFVSLLGEDSDFARRYKERLHRNLEKYEMLEPLDWDAYKEAEHEVDQLTLRREIGLDEASRRLRELRDRAHKETRLRSVREAIEDYGKSTIWCAANDVDMGVVLNLLGQLYPEGTREDAPFRGYKENTDKVWNYVPDDVVRAYLKNKPFHDLDNVRYGNRVVDVTIDAGEETIPIPLDLFVDVAGFSSWQGRSDKYGRPNGNGNKSMSIGNMSSINTMKYYASYPGSPPPVDLVCLYVTPDGRAAVDNGSGDSHRIGAAVLRGEESIRAHRLRVVLLSNNTLPS